MSRPLVGLSAIVIAVACAVPALAQSNLANCKYYTKTQQDFEAGIKYCAECIKDEPDNPEARFYGAWCLAEVGRFSEAWESFHWLIERANEKDKDIQKHAKMATERVNSYYGSHFNEGVKLLNADNVESARGEFLKATEINPTKAAGFLNLGYTQNRLGDIDGALESFRRAIEISPDSTGYDYYSVALGNKLRRLGRDRDSLRTVADSLRKAKADTAAVTSALEKEKAALDQTSGELKATLEKVVALTPSNDAALTQLGELELGAGQDSLAIAHFRKAIELKADNVVQLYNAAVGFYQQNQFEQASKSFAIVTDHADTASTDGRSLWRDAMYNRTLALKSVDRYEEALACVQKLIAFNDSEPDYHELASQIYVKLKQNEKAEAEFERAKALKQQALNGAPGAGK
jgi:tetratricopeptide (TPR) repeat protein